MVTYFAPPNLTLTQLKMWFVPDNEDGSSPCLRYAMTTTQKNLVSLISSGGIRTAGAGLSYLSIPLQQKLVLLEARWGPFNA
jgi:hypothetical protein